MPITTFIYKYLRLFQGRLASASWNTEDEEGEAAERCTEIWIWLRDERVLVKDPLYVNRAIEEICAKAPIKFLGYGAKTLVARTSSDKHSKQLDYWRQDVKKLEQMYRDAGYGEHDPDEFINKIADLIGD